MNMHNEQDMVIYMHILGHNVCDVCVKLPKNLKVVNLAKRFTFEGRVGVPI
jgi:hypothetical protein